MVNKNIKIDEYINNAQTFAQPILLHLRQIIHETCPEVEEKIKWSFPHFIYKGEIICSMAAFKQHCAFVFWEAELFNDNKIMENAKEGKAMGHFGKITSIDDLPNVFEIKKWIKEAMVLNEMKIKIPKKRVAVQEVSIPEDFLGILKKNEEALKNYMQFSSSCKREYVEWIQSAKAISTRENRMNKALQLITEGKSKNWAYQK
jgi:uncharacterized protein YdeI (YjbR/CyaY-like superfamily)